jgi:hypothetical protein
MHPLLRRYPEPLAVLKLPYNDIPALLGQDPGLPAPAAQASWLLVAFCHVLQLRKVSLNLSQLAWVLSTTYKGLSKSFVRLKSTGAGNAYTALR